MTWHSVHIHYHGDQDPLILDCLRPLFSELAEDLSRAFYQRHWRRGPHVRVNVDADPDRYETVIRPAIHAAANRFLATRPSEVLVEEAGFAAVHEQLAAAEQEPGPLTPWHPDNTVVDAVYDDRWHVLGTEQACDLLADFQTVTTPSAFAMTAEAAATGERFAPCLDLMIATAHAFAPLGVVQGAMSMRSHAERFLVLSDAGDELRARWDTSYRRGAAGLRDRVEHVVDSVERGEPAPHVREWLQVLRPVHRRAGEAWASGTLPLPTTIRDPSASFNSPFHNALNQNSVWVDEVRDEPWFQQYRLMLNYMYLHFTRLGLKPVERFWLCHLCACAVEERDGTSAMERLGAAAV